MSVRRRVVAIVAAALAVAATAAPIASASTPNQARQRPDYVALGDSYAAGLGAAPTTDPCGRSALGYPRLIARAAGLKLTLAACSGASLSDVAGNQLGAVTKSADYVTVQVGGNDIGFVPVLSLCAQPDNDAQCAGAIAQSRAYLATSFTGNATALFAAIRARAPQAKLIVVGYARLFSGENCSSLVSFSAAEQKLVNGTIKRLNSRLAEAARLVGGEFANPARAFNGHAWCARVPWINGPVVPVVGSFHPNALGQILGYLPVVGRHFLRD